MPPCIFSYCEAPNVKAVGQWQLCVLSLFLVGRQLFSIQWFAGPVSAHFDSSILKGHVVFGVELEGGRDGAACTPAASLFGQTASLVSYSIYESQSCGQSWVQEGLGHRFFCCHHFPGQFDVVGEEAYIFTDSSTTAFLVSGEPGWSDVTALATWALLSLLLLLPLGVGVSFCKLFHILSTIWSSEAPGSYEGSLFSSALARTRWKREVNGMTSSISLKKFCFSSEERSLL